MTTQSATLGKNRTGIATSRQSAERMIEGTTEFPPSGEGDERVIAAIRESFSKEVEPLGSVPPPTNLKEMAKTAAKSLKGTRPTQFIDKLGERLAFERTGVRLYEGLISKYTSFGGFSGGPTLGELEEILREEHEHFRLLTDVVVRVGGDPTVMTPSADLQATMSKGILEAVVDPRTTFVQCLEAALLAELADNESWEALLDMAKENGEEAAAEAFESALEEEAEHLENVRTWIAASQNRKTE
jgi:hypothetical protein